MPEINPGISLFLGKISFWKSLRFNSRGISVVHNFIDIFTDWERYKLRMKNIIWISGPINCPTGPVNFFTLISYT